MFYFNLNGQQKMLQFRINFETGASFGATSKLTKKLIVYIKFTPFAHVAIIFIIV